MIAFDEWMARFAELDDAAVDDLLRGDTPAGCEDLAPLADLTTAVRQRATAVRPEMGPALRAQIRQPGAVPPRRAGAARRPLQVAVAAVTLAVVGVAAAQNALPAAAQRVVAAAADLVGLDVPRPHDRADDPPNPSTDTGSPTDPTDPGDATDPSDPTDAPDGTPEPRGGPGDTTDPDTTASDGGPPEETPGGATPADPGTPGDGEPATPADPPPHSNGGGSGNRGIGGETPRPNDHAADNARGSASAGGSGARKGSGAPADEG